MASASGCSRRTTEPIGSLLGNTTHARDQQIEIAVAVEVHGFDVHGRGQLGGERGFLEAPGRGLAHPAELVFPRVADNDVDEPIAIEVDGAEVRDPRLAFDGGADRLRAQQRGGIDGRNARGERRR